MVNSKFNKAMAQAEQEYFLDIEKDRDPTKTKKLPVEGMKKENLQNKINKWFTNEEKKMFTGKMSGSIYVDNVNYCKEINDFAAKYMYHNPLHLDTYKELGKMEA